MQLNGQWQVTLEDGKPYAATLPGTLDTNGIGEPFEQKLTTRLTRVVTYSGKALFQRHVTLEHTDEKRWFLSLERTRVARAWINGVPLGEYEPQTLVTPHVYEATGAVRNGGNWIKIEVDNRYPGLPERDILMSSNATEETQTNWNGLIGGLTLEAKQTCFISHLRVYTQSEMACVMLELDCAKDYRGDVIFQCDAFAREATLFIVQKANTRQEYCVRDIPLEKEAKRWDEGEGYLYTLKASASGLEGASCTFGIRTFCMDENHMFSLNGRPVFLRSEANCAVFPETGHPPMSRDAWLAILRQYKAYGVNCMRFHSWCPPGAAFQAADELGMLMQPELSHWNPVDALQSDAAWAYYRREAMQMMKEYANHPSFVMMTLGNELQTNDAGRARMTALLEEMHSYDSTRMYANGSNPHYGQRGPENGSDFYTSSSLGESMLRAISSDSEQKLPGSKGHINNEIPSARTNYHETVKRVHAQYGVPVFSFEVGQFQVLPDFREIDTFCGVTRGFNLEAVRELAQAKGMLTNWTRYVEATGELAAICYREEVEAALRTQGLAGISLLGLQDFPGQGTALVGMMDSHLQPKPFAFAKPERFARQFSATVPLAILPKYTYNASELLSGAYQFANYSKGQVEGCANVCLSCNGKVHAQADYRVCKVGAGGLTMIGGYAFPLSFVPEPAMLDLTLSLGGITNSYRIWVYPHPAMVDAKDVTICEALDAQAVQCLAQGGKVFLTPKADDKTFLHSIQCQFSTDFWSLGTFPWQSGCMGLFIDCGHPALSFFPTSFHSDWQWWPMSHGRAVILDGGLEKVQPIVRVLDSYCRLANLSLLFECRVGKGGLMVSSMGLMQQMQYPETGALLHSILRYMASDAFRPEAELSLTELSRCIQCMPLD